MVLGFSFASWYGGYGVVVLIATGYLFWAAVFTTGHRHVRALRRRFWPQPAPPQKPPVIVLGAPSYHYSTETINERTLAKRAFLTRLNVDYLIENKQPGIVVTDVRTGARRKDSGHEWTFGQF